jgi:D-lyxose ketol-isomerase
MKDTVYIDKPWGHEIIWAQTSEYVGKIIQIEKTHRLSRQYHKIKEETIIVNRGILTLELGNSTNGNTIQTLRLKPGDTFHIRPGLIHRFCAYDNVVILYEVSTSHLDDVVRIEDDYKR